MSGPFAEQVFKDREREEREFTLRVQISAVEEMEARWQMGMAGTVNRAIQPQ